MTNIIGLLQSAGFIAEATKDGMKILKNRSDLNALKKVFEIIREENEKKLTLISKTVKELNISSDDDKIKLADSFTETISLERQLNAFYIVLDGLRKIDVDKISKDGVEKNFFNSYFERSKDITFEDLKGTWSELLKIEVENPGSVTPGVMNVIENLDPIAVKIFDKSAKYIFNNYIFTSMGDESKLNNLRYAEIVHLQDNGIVMQSISSITTNIPLKDKDLYTLSTEKGMLYIGFEEKTAFNVYILTKVGKALKKVIPTSSDPEFLNSLVEFFKSKGAYMIEFSNKVTKERSTLYVHENIDTILKAK
jgi:hypothetical protein